MSSPEPARHALYARLEEVLGPEHAETLMTHIPPQAAGDLATKADIDRLDARFDRLDARFDRLEGPFDRLEEHFHELSAEVRGMHGVMRDQLRTYPSPPSAR